MDKGKTKNKSKFFFYKARIMFFLHFLLLMYSLIGIFSKKASGEVLFSVKYFYYYGFVILILGFYAIGWQQVIKRLPLTIAFANKAVVVVWGFIWGILMYGEQISVGKIIGAVMVVSGVVLFVLSDKEE